MLWRHVFSANRIDPNIVICQADLPIWTEQEVQQRYLTARQDIQALTAVIYASLNNECHSKSSTAPDDPLLNGKLSNFPEGVWIDPNRPVANTPVHMDNARAASRHTKRILLACAHKLGVGMRWRSQEYNAKWANDFASLAQDCCTHSLRIP